VRRAITTTTTLRRVFLGLLLATTIVVTSPTTARAILCEEPAPTAAEKIEEADWAFAGRQTFRWFWQSWGDRPNDRLVRVAVVAVYKGNVPAFVDVNLDYQNASIDSLGANVIGFATTPSKNGKVLVGDCGGGRVNLDELEAHFAGTPTDIQIAPFIWLPSWGAIVVLLAICGGLEWHPPEDLNDALGLD
jgi:hypothetical protein